MNTQVVVMKDEQQPVDLVATVRAAHEVELVAEVDGRVRQLVRDLGDAVDDGGAVVLLDADAASLRFQQADAELQQALVRAGAVDVDALQQPSSLPATPAVLRAQADALEAERALGRADGLKMRKVIAEADHDAARLRVAVTAATLAAALEEQQVAIALSKARAAGAALARKQVRDATLRAPFDAVVSQRLVDLGAWVRAGQVVARLVARNELKLVIDAPEAAAGLVGIGTKLTGDGIEAEVVRVGPVIGEASRTIALEAKLVRSDALHIGAVVHVRAEGGMVVPSARVPDAAVSSLAGVTKIFLVVGDQAQEQRVRVLRKDGGMAVIAWPPGESPTPGSVVAISSIGRLSNGAAVQASAPVSPSVSP